MSDELISPESNGSGVGETLSTPVTPAPEKMLPQSQVNDIVHARTRETAAKHEKLGYERAQAEYQQRQTQNPGQQASSMGGMQQQSPDDIRKMIAEHSDQLQKQAAWSHTVNTFAQRIEAAKTEYPDLESRVAALGIGNIPEVALLATGFDNTADIMDDLSKPENAYKVTNIVAAARTPGLMHLAQQQMQVLVASIKANKTALNSPKANAPLDQINHSIKGTDNGRMSQSDLRNQDWLRG